jgi:hypothetical protein
MTLGIPRDRCDTGAVLFRLTLSMTEVTPQLVVDTERSIVAEHVAAEQSLPALTIPGATIVKIIVATRNVTRSLMRAYH